MAKYTQLEQNDIQNIADHYNLTIITFESIEGGAGNSSYLLDTVQGKYVLTVCDDKVLSEIVKLGQLLLLLQAHNFSTTRILSAKNGDIVTVYRDKPIMLKVYIDGQIYENLAKAMLSKVGVEMAKLHQITAPDYLPNEHSYGRQVFSTIIGRNINPDYESWLKKQFEYFEENIPFNLPRSLIHGDIFYDNVLFENNNFKAIIDFEEACYYYKGFDLGMAIVGLCTENTTIALNKAQALVAGYQQVQKLDPIEKETLQTFVRYAATATSYWRFWKYNIDLPSIDKANKHWQMMQIAKNISRISKTRFWTDIF
jgi:homoserine kinase type II